MHEGKDRYELNLAQRPFVDLTVPAILAFLLLLGIGLFGALNISVFLSASTDDQVLDEQLEQNMQENDKLRSEITNIEASLANRDFRRMKQEIDFANELIDRRSLSWTRLFDRLEELAPAELRMLRISPSIKRGELELNLRVEVPGQKVIRDFISALEESPHFTSITPRSESPSQKAGQFWDLTVKYFDSE